METVAEVALQTAILEIEYERAKAGEEQIYADENARLLRVDLLLQEDANDDLQEQLDQLQDYELKQSEELADDLQARLADMEEQYQTSQDELKACMRDIDQYQAEINALNATTTDSSKTLTEKLSLQRELNNMRPELEHLRSLASAQDNILADKLSLQRELATAQLELENEKRTIHRLKKLNTSPDIALEEELEDTKKELAETQKKIQKLERQQLRKANEKSSADAALVDELESVKQDLVTARDRTQKAEQALKQATAKAAAQDHLVNETTTAELDELRSELTKEKKALHRAEREAFKKTSEWETQKESLETKLDAFRTKLRTTKEQLKEAQDEIERRDQAKFAESAAATKARMTGRAASVEPSHDNKGKKRSVARFDPDMTIGTPGNGGPAAKKARLTGTHIGDKSSFSITPFLNRTLSILPESPNRAIDESINEIAEEAEKAEKTAKEKSAAGKKAAGGKKTSTADKPGATSKSKPLKEASGKANSTAKPPALAKVVEEESEEPQQENTVSKPISNAVADSSTVDSTSGTVQLAKKKKVLAATRTNIFDDDEPDGIKKVGAPNALMGLGKVKLGLNRGKPRMLAEFSPLKKDRRAMASAIGV